VGIESAVERHDALDAVALHHSHVNGAARGERGVSQHDVLRGFSIVAVDGEHVVQDCVEGRLNRLAAIGRRILVTFLLEHLGVGHEAITGGERGLQQALSVELTPSVR